MKTGACVARRRGPGHDGYQPVINPAGRGKPLGLEVRHAVLRTLPIPKRGVRWSEGSVSSVLPTQITYSTRPRVLKRPYGGWSARQWRREALNGIFAALCVTGSWGAMNLGVALIEAVHQAL